MKAAALFDFDLTLADTTGAATECVAYALRRMQLPMASRHSIARTVGLSLPRTFEALTGSSDAARSAEFARWFVERADQVMVEMTVVYSAVADTVQRLRADGLSVAIVSTKFRYRIERILDREGLGHLFDLVVGGEDVARPKPEADGILQALRALGVDAADAVYVGDHPVDAEAARRAGVRFVAALSGHSTAGDFAEFEPLGLISSLGDLPALLARFA